MKMMVALLIAVCSFSSVLAQQGVKEVSADTLGASPFNYQNIVFKFEIAPSDIRQISEGSYKIDSYGGGRSVVLLLNQVQADSITKTKSGMVYAMIQSIEDDRVNIIAGGNSYVLGMDGKPKYQWK